MLRFLKSNSIHPHFWISHLGKILNSTSIFSTKPLRKCWYLIILSPSHPTCGHCEQPNNMHFRLKKSYFYLVPILVYPNLLSCKLQITLASYHLQHLGLVYDPNNPPFCLLISSSTTTFLLSIFTGDWTMCLAYTTIYLPIDPQMLLYMYDRQFSNIAFIIS